MKFNVKDNVITAFGNSGYVKKISIDEEKTLYLISTGSEEHWHTEGELMPIQEQYLKG